MDLGTGERGSHLTEPFLRALEPFLEAAELVPRPRQSGVGIPDLERVTELGKEVEAPLLDRPASRVEPTRGGVANRCVEGAGCEVVHAKS